MATTAIKPSKASTVPIESVFPSPENDDIYGAINPKDIDLVNLAIDIQSNGIREPIHVSLDGYVLSGHRRLAAAKLANLIRVPITRIPISRDVSVSA